MESFVDGMQFDCHIFLMLTIPAAIVDMYRIALRVKSSISDNEATSRELASSLSALEDAWDAIKPHISALGFVVCMFLFNCIYD